MLDASSGIVLPNIPNVPITTGVTAQFFPTAGGEAALAATSAFIAQDQGSAQFRAFAVNSQGANNQLAQSTTDILLLAYGFGSGVSPNAPWMPASYNLGLANHQFNNLAQSDFGSPSVPPWYQPF